MISCNTYAKVAALRNRWDFEFQRRSEYTEKYTELYEALVAATAAAAELGLARVAH